MCRLVPYKLIEKSNNVEEEIAVPESFFWERVRIIRDFLNLHPRLCYVLDDHHQTLLHAAIIQEEDEICFRIIDLAPTIADLNVVNDFGFTALHLAVVSRRLRVIRKLVLSGADPIISLGVTGWYTMHIACMHGNLDTVKALIEPLTDEEMQNVVQLAPHDLEAKDHDGNTCLIIAVVSGFTDIVRYLAQRGAGEIVRACVVAILDKSRELVSCLIQTRPEFINGLTPSGHTLYQVALFTKNPDIAKDLLDLGADPTLGRPMDYTKPLDMMFMKKYD